eukprot:768104-Hanusia_phi.AAC.3
MDQDTQFLDDLVPSWLSVAEEPDRLLQRMISKAAEEWALHVYPSDIAYFQRPSRVLFSIVFAQLVDEDPLLSVAGLAGLTFCASNDLPGQIHRACICCGSFVLDKESRVHPNDRKLIFHEIEQTMQFARVCEVMFSPAKKYREAIAVLHLRVFQIIINSAKAVGPYGEFSFDKPPTSILLERVLVSLEREVVSRSAITYTAARGRIEVRLLGLLREISRLTLSTRDDSGGQASRSLSLVLTRDLSGREQRASTATSLPTLYHRSAP